MNETLFKISTASLIITSSYNKLISLALADMEESEEYQEYNEKIKKYVSYENELYQSLSEKDINEYDTLMQNISRFDNQVDARIYSRINDIKRIKNNQPVINNNILLSSIISSKLTIDILKNVDHIINNLTENEELDETDITMLNLYKKRYKYHYLTSNYFIEKLSIEHNFELNNIPSYSYEAIEDRFDIRFLDNIQNNFYNYVITSLEELANMHSDNKYVLIYSSIFEIARIESIIEYLDLNSLNKLFRFINEHKTKYDCNSALRKVRKIIIKKKEEFNDR